STCLAVCLCPPPKQVDRPPPVHSRSSDGDLVASRHVRGTLGSQHPPDDHGRAVAAPFGRRHPELARTPSWPPPLGTDCTFSQRVPLLVVWPSSPVLRGRMTAPASPPPSATACRSLWTKARSPARSRSWAGRTPLSVSTRSVAWPRRRTSRC